MAENIPALLRLADEFAREGRASDAIEQYQKAAELYFAEGLYLKAVAVYRQILHMDETQWDVHVDVARVYMELGLLDDALRALRTGAAGLASSGDTRKRNDALKLLLEMDPFDREAGEALGVELSLPEPVAKNAELEQAIRDNPNDDQAYLVYGDWLQAQRDPRGELVAVQYALANTVEPGKRRELQQTEAALLAAHREYLLWVLPRFIEVQWHLGFLRSVRVREGLRAESMRTLLRFLARLPSSSFLRELMVENPGAGSAVSEVASQMPLLRSLRIGPHPSSGEQSVRLNLEPVDIRGLSDGRPELETLSLTGREVISDGFDFPSLREVHIGWLNDDEIVEAIHYARWPCLESLTVVHADLSPTALARILANPAMESLQHLGISVVGECPRLDRVLPQLTTLTLWGQLSDIGAAAIAGNPADYAHLEHLYIRARVSRRAKESLLSLPGVVVSGTQGLL